MILIAIGSNLPHPEVGQPREVCEAALNRLAQSGVRILRRSPWYGSAPVPASDQPWFVNGVAEVELEASGSPQSLLAALHAVEGELGRTRNRRNEARIVDLDLIDFEGRVSAPDASPLLPHPRLQERAFIVRIPQNSDLGGSTLAGVQTYANRVVPEARGDAARVIQAAEGYRERVVFDAQGQAARFINIYDEYAKAPEVTRRRMYLETMERVFDGVDKVIVDPGTARNGSGVVPYLPLGELGGARGTGSSQQPSQSQRPNTGQGGNR